MKETLIDGIHFMAFVVVSLVLSAQADPLQHQQEPLPHDQQPAYCVNHAGYPEYPMEEPHICMCDKPCHEGEPEDRACKVYCRKDNCHCLAECDAPPPGQP